MTPSFFHADLDAFFASVEQLDFPELRGKPVIVGAAPDKRGVVAACSYEARTFGVHSAMPSSRAYKLCPQACFRPSRMERYRELSRAIMAVFGDFSPEVRQISVDEAFLDMTGTAGLFGPPEEAGRSLKARVKAETGLSVSVGAAANRYVAKLASARSKPDGLLVVPYGGEEEFMRSIPLQKIWGIGEKTLERLARAGLDSADRVRAQTEGALRRVMGEAGGLFLYRAVRGIDPGIFPDEPKSRSVSGETTFEKDVVDEEVIEATLVGLAQELAFRLIDEGLQSRTVHLKIRYDDFETVGMQESLRAPVRSAEELLASARSLMERKRERGRPVRLLGLGLMNAESLDEAPQGELFEDASSKRAKVERAVWDLKKSKGALVTKARLVPPPSVEGGPKGGR